MGVRVFFCRHVSWRFLFDNRYWGGSTRVFLPVCMVELSLRQYILGGGLDPFLFTSMYRGSLVVLPLRQIIWGCGGASPRFFHHSIHVGALSAIIYMGRRVDSFSFPGRAPSPPQANMIVQRGNFVILVFFQLEQAPEKSCSVLLPCSNDIYTKQANL